MMTPLIGKAAVVSVALASVGVGLLLAGRPNVPAPTTRIVPKAPQMVPWGLKPTRAEMDRFNEATRTQEAQVQAAVALWRSGHRAEAEAELRRLTERDPLGASRTLATLYEEAGESQKAYVFWKRLLLAPDVGIDGTEARGLALRAARLADQYGTPAESLALWQKAAGDPTPPDPSEQFAPGLEFDPRDPTQLRAAAILRAAGGAPLGQAIDLYLESLRLRPGWGVVYYVMGHRLSLEGRHREAAAALQEATRLGTPAVRRAADALYRKQEGPLAKLQEQFPRRDKTPKDSESLFERLPTLAQKAKG